MVSLRAVAHLRAWPRVCLVLYYSVGLCITLSPVVPCVILHPQLRLARPRRSFLHPRLPRKKQQQDWRRQVHRLRLTRKMPEEADPYAFNAPQYADLASEAKAGGVMSPATHAWFGAPSPLASCPSTCPAPCLSCALLSTQMTSRARTEVLDQCRMSRHRRRRRLRSSRSSRCPRPPPSRRRLHPRPGRLAHLPARTSRLSPRGRSRPQVAQSCRPAWPNLRLPPSR